MTKNTNNESLAVVSFDTRYTEAARDEYWLDILKNLIGRT